MYITGTVLTNHSKNDVTVSRIQLVVGFTKITKTMVSDLYLSKDTREEKKREKSVCFKA